MFLYSSFHSTLRLEYNVDIYEFVLTFLEYSLDSLDLNGKKKSSRSKINAIN